MSFLLDTSQIPYFLTASTLDQSQVPSLPPFLSLPQAGELEGERESAVRVSSTSKYTLLWLSPDLALFLSRSEK